MKEQPDDRPPSGTVDAAAVGVHEIFLSYVRAGFTRSEALTIVLKHIEIQNLAGRGDTE
jgi:hypothetical protein